MKNIDGFTITKVTMIGFNSFKETKTVEFQSSSYIYGTNRQGKTTIADAIAFAFTGRTFYGESANDLLNVDSTQMSVQVEFVDEHNEAHTLIRNKVGSKMIINFDSYNVTQEDIESAFCKKALFLSMLNPLYFVDKLQKDGRELLEMLLPVVPHEEVLAAMTDSERKLLENEHLLSLAVYLENRRKEIVEIQGDLDYNTAQKDLIERQKVEIGKTIVELQKEIAAWKAKEEALIVIRDTGRDKTAEGALAMQLQMELDELLENDGQDKKEIIHNLSKQLETLKERIATRKQEQYQPERIEALAEMKATLDKLYSEHSQIKELIDKSKPGFKCPTCFSEVTEANHNDFIGILSIQLSKCILLGQKQKQLYNDEVVKDHKAKSLFEKKRDHEVQALEIEAKALEDEIFFTDVQLNSLKDTIKEKETELGKAQVKELYGNLNIEQIVEYGSCIQNIALLEEQLTERIGALNGLNKYNFDDSIATFEQEIKQKKRLVQAAKRYTEQKYEILFKSIALNRVKFKLYDLVKSTGEMKSVFSFTYNGRSFNRLSFSESVLARLEISELLKRLSGKNYPVFLDNMESIVEIDNVKPTGQIFMAYVVKNQPLTIRPFKPNVAEKAA